MFKTTKVIVKKIKIIKHICLVKTYKYVFFYKNLFGNKQGFIVKYVYYLKIFVLEKRMKKHLNKIFSCLIALVLFAGFGFMLTACNDSSNPEVKTTKVVNLSLNPSVEFILDKNNNVLTFNAINDEGNFIIINANFVVGETINSAVEKFLKVAKDNGFIVDGENEKSTNQLKIEVSGNSAVNLYNQIKAKAQNYLNQFNIEFTSSFKKITKADLQTLVINSTKEVFALRLTEEQLIEYIKNSRQETESIYSQELKNLYYELRYQEISKANFQAVINEFLEVENLPDLRWIESLFDLGGYDGESVSEKFAAYLNEKISVFANQITELKEFYLDNTINNDYYTQAFNNYIEAKQTLLEARLSGDVSSQDMEEIEQALLEAEINFYGDEDGLNAEGTESFFTNVENLFDEKREEIKPLKGAIETALNLILEHVNQQEVDESVELIKANFATSFKNGEFKTFIDNSIIFWNNLKPSVV